MKPLDTAQDCGALFAQLAQQWPDKLALEAPGGHSLSFFQLDQRINRLSQALIARGLSKGDRVAIIALNCTQFIEVIGLSKAGAIIVPINWRLGINEILRLLQHSDPRVIVVDRKHHAAIHTIKQSLPGVRTWMVIDDRSPGWESYEELMREGANLAPNVSIQGRDPLCIVYTSGTTGEPKGVTLTHTGALGNARVAVGEMLGLTEDDRALAVMPLFHVGGLWYYLFPALAAGGSSVILPQFDVAAVLKALPTHQITNIHLVPTMIAALLQHPDTEPSAFNSLRLMFYAASSMPPSLLREAMKVFANCGFVQAYGSTESGVVTVLDPEAHKRARTEAGEHLLLSCGHAMQGRSLRIVDAQGQVVPMGAIGEIEVNSPDLMPGYWQDEASTRRVLRGGWLAMGDLGYQDGEGFIYIADRKNDMIVTGGENVFPSEVESYLYNDPAVKEAAVFGLADPKWVERVVAAVVLKPGFEASESDLLDRLKTQLAAYKCPKAIYFVSGLPKNAIGKVLRKQLRSQFSAGS